MKAKELLNSIGIKTTTFAKRVGMNPKTFNRLVNTELSLVHKERVIRVIEHWYNNDFKRFKEAYAKSIEEEMQS